jgi:hypothetical protein
MSVKVSVNISGLERYFFNVDQQFRAEMERVILNLTQEAEATAKQILTVLVYDTPETERYRRTGALLRSVYAVSQKVSQGNWLIRIGASGSDERQYAWFVETGTFAGHRTFDQILADAQAATAELIVLEYGRPSKGVQPKPFVVPSLVHTVQRAPPLIIQAVKVAAKR